jgi:predicted O-methyltransferase YrrM
MSHTNATPSLDYIRAHYAAQDDLLLRIDAKLHEIELPMHIGPEEGKLLQLLMRMHGVKTVLEIGTLAGYSTIWMARGLPEGGHITTINKDAPHIVLAKEFFSQCEVKERITMLEGDAHKLLPTLAGKQFDMIFIDADKISYPAYLDHAEKLVKKDGLVIADNTLLFGAVGLDTPPENLAPNTWKAMRTFGERMADQSRYFSTLIPTEQGMTVAIKLF